MILTSFMLIIDQECWTKEEKIWFRDKALEKEMEAASRSRDSLVVKLNTTNDNLKDWRWPMKTWIRLMKD